MRKKLKRKKRKWILMIQINFKEKKTEKCCGFIQNLWCFGALKKFQIIN